MSKKQVPIGADQALAPLSPQSSAPSSPEAEAPVLDNSASGAAPNNAAEKALERQLMEEDDLAFDPLMVSAPKVSIDPQTSAAMAADPNLPKAIASELAKEMAQFVPNPVAQAETIGAIVDKIVRGLREPTEEQKREIERKKRDRATAIREQQEMLRARKEHQDSCPHETETADGKTHSNISAVHNYHDGIVRGICSLCLKMIEPHDSEYKIVKARHQQAARSMMTVG